MRGAWRTRKSVWGWWKENKKGNAAGCGGREGLMNVAGSRLRQRPSGRPLGVLSASKRPLRPIFGSPALGSRASVWGSLTASNACRVFLVRRFGLGLLVSESVPRPAAVSLTAHRLPPPLRSLIPNPCAHTSHRRRAIFSYSNLRNIDVIVLPTLRLSNTYTLRF